MVQQSSSELVACIQWIPKIALKIGWEIRKISWNKEEMCPGYYIAMVVSDVSVRVYVMSALLEIQSYLRGPVRMVLWHHPCVSGGVSMLI